MYNTTLLPPQDIEAEQSVLGALLIDSDKALTVSEILKPDDFYKQSHQKIYSACMDCYQAGNLDIIALKNRLAALGELQAVGGLSYLANLSSIATAATAEYHAKIVKDKSTARKILRWTQTINEQLYNHSTTAETIKAAEQGLIVIADSILSNRKSPKVEKINQKLRDGWEKIKAGEFTGIKTDYKIQSAIPALFRGNVWLIGGYTSTGKSTLLAQLVVDFAYAGAKICIFSAEDRQEDKGIKLIANLADISQRRLIMGYLDGYEDAVAKAQKQLDEWDILIYDDIYSLDELRLKVKKHKMQSGLDIVCIDYIQNFRDNENYESFKKGIIGLQSMAKELEVALIVLSQVSNESMKEGSEIIGLKGAGELAAIADVVLWLRRHKDREKKQWLDVEIRKNRIFGETGIIPMVFSEKWTRINRR